jgi:hypothetical protein
MHAEEGKQLCPAAESREPKQQKETTEDLDTNILDK